MSAKIAVISSVTWLTGWIVPWRRGRAGSVTSSHSALQPLVERGIGQRGLLGGERRIDLVLQRVQLAGPATCRSSGSSCPVRASSG
jgi:hypothetical protein